MLPIELNEGVTISAQLWFENVSKYRFQDLLSYNRTVLTQDDIHIYFTTSKKYEHANLCLIFKTTRTVAVQITKPDNESKLFYLFPGVTSLKSFGNYGGDFVVVLRDDKEYASLKDIYSGDLTISTSFIDVPHCGRRTFTDGVRDASDSCGIVTTKGTSSQRFIEMFTAPDAIYSTKTVRLFVHVEDETDHNLCNV